MPFPFGFSSASWARACFCGSLSSFVDMADQAQFGLMDILFFLPFTIVVITTADDISVSILFFFRFHRIDKGVSRFILFLLIVPS